MRKVDLVSVVIIAVGAFILAYGLSNFLSFLTLCANSFRAPGFNVMFILPYLFPALVYIALVWVMFSKHGKIAEAICAGSGELMYRVDITQQGAVEIVMLITGLMIFFEPFSMVFTQLKTAFWPSAAEVLKDQSANIYRLVGTLAKMGCGIYMVMKRRDLSDRLTRRFY